MGRVLLGSGADGRLVAVKVVHEQLAEDDGFRGRFRREVEASRVVSGAYTAAIVDADTEADMPWLASVFVPGPSLHEVLTAVGALPPDAVLRLAAGLATALTHIHRAGLVHRDLKPSNVLVTGDGPRVIDFGIVRAVSDGRGDELTRTGWLVGSPAFMSPEQADGGSVGAASDVFSLGSVVVAAATGVSPFAGAATLHTLNNVVRVAPKLDGVPAAVRRVVEPCFAKEPGDRPTPAEVLASIGQIAPASQPWPEAVHQLIVRRQAEIAEVLEPGQDLTVVMSERPAGSTLVDDAGSGTPPPPSPTLVRRPWASRRWVRVAALVVVLAVAGALTWVGWPSTEADPGGGGGGGTTAEDDEPAFEQIAQIDVSSVVEGVVFSPSGDVLTTRLKDKTVQSWGTADQKQVGQILASFNGKSVAATAFSADERTLLTARVEDDKKSVVVEQWDVATGRPAQPFVVQLDQARAWTPAFSPDGRTLAVSVASYTAAAPGVHLWDIPGQRAIGSIDTRGWAAAFSDDGRTVVVADWGDDNSAVTRWRVADVRQVGEPVYLPDNEIIRAAAFDRETGGLITISDTSVQDGDDGYVRWWDFASRNQVRQPLTIDPSSINQALLGPDGVHLAVTSPGKHLTVWNLDTGKQVGRTMDDVTAVAFGPDGTLATGIPVHRVRLWRLPGR
jgi:hypothetical protein